MKKFFGILAVLVLTHWSAAQAAPTDDQIRDFRQKHDTFIATQKRGEWKSALPIAEELYQIASRQFGAKHLHTARVALELGVLYRELGKYEEAEDFIGRSLRARREQLGEDDVLVGEALLQLGALHEIVREFKQADDALRQSLAIYQTAEGGQSANLAKVFSVLSLVQEGQGDLREAAKSGERAVEILKGQSDPDRVHLGRALSTLGHVYIASGEYQKAEESLTDAIDLLKRELGEGHPHVASAVFDLASVYFNRGQYARARQLYAVTLAVREAKLGPDHLHTAFVYNDLGLIAWQLGQLNQARSLMEKSVEIKKRATGEDSLEVAKGLQNLGAIAYDFGQIDQAETYCRAALKLKSDHLGDDHPLITSSLGNLASIFVVTNRLDAAEECYKRCLAIEEEKLGIAHPHTIQTRSNLASYYLRIQQPEKAESLVNQSLAGAKEVLGAEHPLVAKILASNADYYRQQQNRGRAIFYLQEGIQILEKTLGSEHPDVAAYLGDLAVDLAEQKRAREAMDTADRARRISRRYIANVLPGMPEAQQLRFLGYSDSYHFHRALSIGMRQGKGLPDIEKTAEWVLNGKSVSLEALTANIARVRNSDDPKVRELSQELASVRSQLSGLLTSTPARGEIDEYLRELADVRERQRTIQRELSESQIVESPDEVWVQLNDLRAALPKGSVLVEFARFYESQFGVTASSAGKKWTPKHLKYAAWVIPPEGEGLVRRVSLGYASDIDRKISDVRRAIALGMLNVRAASESEAENELKQNLTELSKEILKPIEASIRHWDHWILSPDVNLWFVPWAALLTEDDAYAVEKHSISYVVTGRDILGEWTSENRQAPLIVANPDYNLGVPKDPESPEAFSPLPGTAKEAQVIVPFVERYCKAKPAVVTGAKATEQVVKSANRPQMLVLSTHGYFLPVPSYVQINPLLRCGLAFAGANRGGSIQRAEDGVLSGLEVVGIDLNGTDLVVLSACETGVGESTDGEGVAGLRQAFQFAGARSVVSTLWSIPDLETADLMGTFFQELADGKNHADALRAAQLETIEARRKKHGAAHPLYWAAFTLTTKHLERAIHDTDTPDEKHPRLIATLNGHDSRVSHVTYGAHGEYLASADGNGFVNVWDADTYRILNQYPQIERGEDDPPIPFTAVEILPDQGALCATYGQYLRLWGLKTSLSGAGGGSPPVALSSHGWYVRAAGDECRSLIFSHLATHARFSEFVQFAHANRISAVAVSRDEQYVASASSGTIKIWKGKTGEEVVSLSGPEKEAECIAIDGRQQLVACGYQDGNIKVWSIASARLVADFNASKAAVSCVVFSPDGGKLATSGGDESFKIWDARTGQLVERIADHAGAVNSLAFSPDGQILMTGSDDRTIKLWSLEGLVARHSPVAIDRPFGLKHILKGHAKPVQAIAFSPNDGMVATSSSDATIKLWDLASEQAVWTLPGRYQGIAQVAFTEDGKHLACENDDQILYVNTADGSVVNSIPKDKDALDIQFDHGAKRVAAGQKNGVVKVWEVATGSQVAEFQGQANPQIVNPGSPHEFKKPRAEIRFQISPDGRLLVLERLGGFDVWDIQSRDKVWEFDASAVQTILKFSHDNAELLVDDPAHGSRTINLRDADTGEILRSVPMNPSAIGRWIFQPDGELRSWSADETDGVRLWKEGNLSPLKPTVSFGIKESGIRFLTFNTNGQLIATAGYDGLVRIWDIDAIAKKTTEASLQRRDPKPQLNLRPQPSPARAASDNQASIVKWIAAMAVVIAASVVLAYRRYKSRRS